MEKRLYAVIHPHSSLIASQLDHGQFAKHYIAGSTRHHSGKMIFAEIDINFRNAYFAIDDMLKKTLPHEDGRPKATKFISSYRVLEHLDLDAIKHLLISDMHGEFIELQKQAVSLSDEKIHLFAVLNPQRMLTLSNLNHEQFGEYITHERAKGSPTICFTQLQLDYTSFLEEIENHVFATSPVVDIHPKKLESSLKELLAYPNKRTKGLSFDVNFNNLSYKSIKNGISFCAKDTHLFFKMPSLREIESINLRFYHTM